MDFQVKIGGKKIKIPEVKKLGTFGKFKGLMFSRREKSRALLFDSRGNIHSFFCFFPFLILWVDKENNILDKRIVKSWKMNVNSKTNYSKFIEIPLNRRYNESLDFFVDFSSEKSLKKKEN